MKIIDLLRAQQSIETIMTRKMPGKLAYAFSKNFRLINLELEYYNEARIKLLSDNWPFDGKTQSYSIPEEDKEKWKQIHDELLNSESSYKPYTLDANLVNDIELTPGELFDLWFLFEEFPSVNG